MNTLKALGLYVSSVTIAAAIAFTIAGCSYISINDSQVTLGDDAAMIERMAPQPLIGLENHAAPPEERPS